MLTLDLRNEVSMIPATGTIAQVDHSAQVEICNTEILNETTEALRSMSINKGKSMESSHLA